MMSNKSFKCLVQLNDFNHRIIIDDNSNITFSIVLSAIQTQINENISHETHSFEIFDFDFEEYVLITSCKQIIDNLSRIRVLPTNKGNSRVSSIPSAKESLKSVKPTSTIEGSLSSALIDLNEDSINTINKVQNFLDSNDFIVNETIDNLPKPKVINNENAPVNEEVIKSLSNQPVTNSLKSELVANNSSAYLNDFRTQPKQLINYFGPKIQNPGRTPNSSQLYFETAVEELENVSTIVLKFSSDETNAYRSLLRIITENIYLFKTESSKVNLNNSWKVVSNSMIIIGHNKWSPKKCMDSFMGSVNLYKKVLENAPNYELASKVYPLFESIHSLDLKYFIKTKSLETIIELRKNFEIKINKQKKSLVLNEYQVEKDLTKSKVNANDTRICANSTDNSAFNLNNSNKSHKKKSKRKSKSKSKELLQKQMITEASKLSDNDMKAFKLMMLIMDSIVAEMGRNAKNFWELVSNEMTVNGFLSFTATKCEQTFTSYVCNYYKLTLTHSPDYETASSTYPLFEFIYKLNLEPLLRVRLFRRIDKKRKMFDKRISVIDGKGIETELNDKLNTSKPIGLNRIEPRKQLLVNEFNSVSIKQIDEQLEGLKLNENIISEEIVDKREEKCVPIENWKLQKVINFKLSETPKRYVIVVTVKYDNSLNVLPKKSTDLSVVKFRFLKPNAEEIEIFYSIVELINKNKNYFLVDSKSDDKWMRVSEGMIDIGYNEFTSIKCREFFQNFKSVYVQLLQYAPNYRTASNIYPLFEWFHSMDLKHLSQERTYNKIMTLKDKPDFDFSFNYQ